MSPSAPAETSLSIPGAGIDLELRRHPERGDGRRAWDAADELVLRWLADGAPELGGEDGRTELAAPMVVLNDRCGALALGLGAATGTETTTPAPITVVHPSWSAGRALELNAEANGVNPASLRWTPEPDTATLPGRVATLVFRPDRHLARFEERLRRIAPLLGPGSTVVGTEMVKHLHSSTLEVCERVLGPTSTTRAARRARLILTAVEPRRSTPWPWPRHWTHDTSGLSMVTRPGTFSATGPDRGTELLLAHLPAIEPGARVVDLGCGSGLLGLVAAARQPAASVTLIDDDHSAVMSVRDTIAANPDILGASDIDVRHGNGLEGGAEPVEPGSVDVILCNPPFHDDQAVGDAIAWQFFGEAARALRRGGELRVVGNRHLGHHAKLKRRLGNCEVVASDRRFVVLRAVRS